MGIVRRVRSMTRAVGVLGGVDEPENGSTRWGHCESNGVTEELRLFWGNSNYTAEDFLEMVCRGGGQWRKAREGQLEPPAICQ